MCAPRLMLCVGQTVDAVWMVLKKSRKHGPSYRSLKCDEMIFHYGFSDLVWNLFFSLEWKLLNVRYVHTFYWFNYWRFCKLRTFVWLLIFRFILAFRTWKWPSIIWWTASAVKERALTLSDISYRSIYEVRVLLWYWTSAMSTVYYILFRLFCVPRPGFDISGRFRRYKSLLVEMKGFAPMRVPRRHVWTPAPKLEPLDS